MLIARALGRPGVFVALGSVWDESAIRGLPISFRSPQAGRIVLGLRKAGIRNPVMILDEIDKVGGATTNFGDPSAALLEVLDPAQNTHFRDAYVELTFDLSEVLFISTANDVANIPAPLRDRLEVIEAPGYTDDEKVDIVRRVLWEEQLEVNGLAGGFWTRTPAAALRGQAEEASGAASAVRRLAGEVLDGEQAVPAPTPTPPAASPSGPLTAGAVEVTDAAIRAVVRGHTCEGGVRHLVQNLGAIWQFVASRRVEAGVNAPVTIVAVADEAERLDAAGLRFSVAEIQGPPRYDALPDHVRDALSRGRDRVVGLHPADPEAAAAQAWIEVTEQVPWRPSAERLDAPARLRRHLTGYTSTARGRRTRRWTTWWPVRPPRRGARTPARPRPVPLRGGGHRHDGFRPGPGRSSRPPVPPGVAGRRREAGGHSPRRPLRAARGAGAPRRRSAAARPPAGPGRRQPASRPR